MRGPKLFLFRNYEFLVAYNLEDNKVLGCIFFSLNVLIFQNFTLQQFPPVLSSYVVNSM